MTTEILIVDDDAAIRAVLSLYLRSRGYSTVTAENGAAGLAHCAQSLPSLVLCDLRMPGMDGQDVLAALRRDHPELPVIVVSGTGDLGDAIKALKQGASDYVTKPIEDLAVLDHAVSKALERARLIAENRAHREHLETVNARLASSLRQIEADEACGREIQFALLPAPRVLFGHYECSRYLATSAILSGDFVNYFMIDREHFGFYMADVSGHGVASAVITVLLDSYVGRYLENYWRYADRTILDPAALLAALNREFLAGHHGKYLTMFCGVVSPADEVLVFANGGQFPFPLMVDEQAVSEIGGRSPPVGLFPSAQYTNQRIAIPPHFALRVFSDGVLDLLSPSDLRGRKAALRTLAVDADRDAGQLARALGLDLPRVLPDDASVLCLRRVAAHA